MKLKFKKTIQTPFGKSFLIPSVVLTAIVLFNLSFAQFQTPPPPTSQSVEGPQQSAGTPDGRPLTPTSLPAPKILSPKNGKVVSGDKVTLKWKAVKGATWYSYEMLYRQPGETDFVGSGVPAGGSATTSAEFDLTGIPDGTGIHWLVSGSNMAIGQGGWVSEEAEFVYQKTKNVKKSAKQKPLKKTGEPISAEQTEVEKALQEDLPRIREEIRRLAKEELEIELPERVPEKSQYEGIEGSYHIVVLHSDSVEKYYKEGNYEKALRVISGIKRTYDELLSSMPEYKEKHAQEVAAATQRKADEEAAVAFEKQQEEGYKAVQKQLADAKAAEVKMNKKTKACVDKYLKFTPPAKYAMSFLKTEYSLCPSLTLIPPTTNSYWSDDQQKTIYEGGPQITVEFFVPKQNYLDGAFVAEKMKEGARFKAINGSPWYYMKLDGETTFAIGESYEAFVDNTQIRFTILLNIGDPGEDPRMLQKIKSDFDKMMKTVKIRTDVPIKTEPLGLPTKEKLLLQGSWKLIKSFSKEFLEEGFDKNPLAGSPVKAYLIAFRLDKICIYIQEENTNKCYAKYVPYKLTENVLVFKYDSENRWEILKNTVSELEIIDQKGTKNIFQKVSSESPSDR